MSAISAHEVEGPRKPNANGKSYHVCTDQREEQIMEIVIITFGLEGMTEADFVQRCEQLAPAFAAMSGLQSKVWLADPVANTYGGVYTFASEADVEEFLASRLFAGSDASPHLVDVTVRRFGVIEEATRITRGMEAARS